MYAIGRALATLVAPILCFTAEDIWGYLPRKAGDPDSVHLAKLPEGAALDEKSPLAAEWELLLAYRDRTLKALEPFRVAKHKPLDAAATVTAPAADREILARHDLLQIFGVSSVSLQDGEPGVTVAEAEGNHCERCWKYTSAPPPICDRCRGVLKIT
jgi:isoleucyl-tRNA synthetase